MIIGNSLINDFNCFCRDIRKGKPGKEITPPSALSHQSSPARE
jgi:hypothetical protein